MGRLESHPKSAIEAAYTNAEETADALDAMGETGDGQDPTKEAALLEVLRIRSRARARRGGGLGFVDERRNPED